VEFHESRDREVRVSGPDAGDGSFGPGREPDARPVPEADAFTFTARPQAGGWTDLPWGTDDLTLAFDHRGIAIRGSARGAQDAGDWTSAVFPWASVTRVVRGATEVAPDGRGSVTAVDIEASGRSMRFSMWSPGRDPVQLTAWSEQVQHWAAGDEQGAGAPRAESVLLPRTVPTLLLPDRDDPAGNAPRPGDAHVPELASHPDRALEPGPAAGPDPTAVNLPVTSAPRPGPVRPASPPAPARHRRRKAGLAAALVIVVAGTGLAVSHSLSDSNGSQVSAPATADAPANGNANAPAPAAAPAHGVLTPDQALADRLVLGTGDLPAGWTATSDSGGPAGSPKIEAGESKVTASFAQCMGIDEARASLALSGGAADQTAQKMSPVFVGPPSPGRPGYALELQTAVDIVRNHQDEQQDFELFGDPRYPRCAAAAVASEAQLGADSTARTSNPPGQSSGSPVPVPTAAGEQASGLLVTFTVSDRTAAVPVEVVIISIGYDRIEANLQVLAIGGQVPSGAITMPLSAFEQRVAEEGAGAQA
jgi:hypothetical protein